MPVPYNYCVISKFEHHGRIDNRKLSGLVSRGWCIARGDAHQRDAAAARYCCSLHRRVVIRTWTPVWGIYRYRCVHALRLYGWIIGFSFFSQRLPSVLTIRFCDSTIQRDNYKTRRTRRTFPRDSYIEVIYFLIEYDLLISKKIKSSVEYVWRFVCSPIPFSIFIYFIFRGVVRCREATISRDKNVIETRHARNLASGEPRLRARLANRRVEERRGVVSRGRWFHARLISAIDAIFARSRERPSPFPSSGGRPRRWPSTRVRRARG